MKSELGQLVRLRPRVPESESQDFLVQLGAVETVKMSRREIGTAGRATISTFREENRANDVWSQGLAVALSMDHQVLAGAEAHLPSLPVPMSVPATGIAPSPTVEPTTSPAAPAASTVTGYAPGLDATSITSLIEWNATGATRQGTPAAPGPHIHPRFSACIRSAAQEHNYP
ncbi:hypothetical protein L6164_015767 [Bauhinia variegata]|uniref:Uncharacterized protein n=1 Tax=Bauhinia variegata TaxID=167791 RepID=A0ACB9NQC5_BAUVA|nr:hypothetical protein L6164_015767 [Bauhinia variegata]